MTENVTGNRTPQEEALAGEIEQTRQQLGETVEALAAKTDVKARAQRRAAEVTGNLRGKARAVKDKVTVQAGQLRDRAAAKASQAEGTAPAPVQRSARQAAGTARAHPGVVAAAAGALILAWLAMRQLRDRRG